MGKLTKKQFQTGIPFQIKNSAYVFAFKFAHFPFVDKFGRKGEFKYRYYVQNTEFGFRLYYFFINEQVTKEFLFEDCFLFENSDNIKFDNPIDLQESKEMEEREQHRIQNNAEAELKRLSKTKKRQMSLF